MKGKNNESKIMKSVLFILPEQFGYSAGYYYYCKYLAQNGYKVGVVCVNQNKPEVFSDESVEIQYIISKNKFQYRFELFKNIWNAKKKYDNIIVKFFSGCFIGIFPWDSKIILDIRSGSVRKSKFLRHSENLSISFHTLFFNKIFILSEHLAKKLQISKKKIVWLPLGADELATNEKNYTKSINLLYIGTFEGRNIDVCIEGFAKFYSDYSKMIPITFDIIGNGSVDDVKRIMDLIELFNLQKSVKLHGEMHHIQAIPYFEKCNYGVSYIPMTDFYNLQPPTKVFEYVLSGLVCVATNTFANRELISNENGILHNDNAIDFYFACKRIFELRFQYDTQLIKMSLSRFKWKNIVENILINNLYLK